MITALLVATLALALTAFVALPLVNPNLSDALPDYRDPLQQELEEERDALFRAIRELDARTDLGDARREELRARYEAKAARVLRSLDERERALAGEARAARPAGPRRIPWAAAGLLGLVVAVAAPLGGWVLPRVGDASVTTFFQEDLSAAQRLQELERAAQDDPTTETLVTLGDARWDLQEADAAQEAYRRALDTGGEAPARAYRRLGLLTLQEDLDEAERLLERARERDPDHPDTLATLGELYLARGAYAEAQEVFETLAETPEAAEDAVAQERLALAREVAPLAEAAVEDPGQDTLLALGEALWSFDLRNPAADAYLQVLQEFDAGQPTALARLGRLLFESGRQEEARALLERARMEAGVRGVELPPRTLLFLGNVHFSQRNWDAAIDAWEAHLETTDEPGRVPGLIEEARARRDGEVPADAEVALPGPETQAAVAAPGSRSDAADGGGGAGGGAALFAEHCAACHGPQGGGASGPRLTGNPTAGRPALVEDLIRTGRGSMPGFRAVLDDAEVEALRDHVVDAFAP